MSFTFFAKLVSVDGASSPLLLVKTLEVMAFLVKVFFRTWVFLLIDMNGVSSTFSTFWYEL